MLEVLVLSVVVCITCAALALGELVMVQVDKLYECKEKAPRTLACPKAQGNDTTKSVA